jgi:dinuclear metal center YbgI/SA1388 family protein
MARTGAPRAARPNAAATVRELHAALDALAPFELAAEWDNVGLLAGRMDWPVRRALLAIDLTDAVAAEALRTGAQALVLYHPPIFKGIRTITPGAAAPTTQLFELLAGGVALLAVHTALDAAPHGTNDLLLDAFATVERWPLEPVIRCASEYKIVVFVPAADVPRLRSGLAAAGAGVIGHYGECSFELAGRGTFRGDATTRPAVGRAERLEHADEVRLEMVVPAARLGAVVRAVYQHHPYEEPAFDLYPVHKVALRGAAGLGRAARLRRPQRGAALLEQLSAVVDLSAAQVVGDLRRSFTGVVAAAGSFGVNAFRDPSALVLTGEFKHHDALELLRRGVTAVALGHYASERPALAYLRRELQRRVRGVRVAVSRADGPPLRALDVRRRG